MSERRSSIKIRVENVDYEVVGGDFQQLLAAVKALPKRRFDGQNKLWHVSASLQMVRGQLENSGFALEGGTPVSAAVQEAIPVSNDRIKIEVGGYPLAVTGKSFQEMLAAIKEVPGRRFDGESKQWSLPIAISEAKAYFEKRDIELEGLDQIGSAPPQTQPDTMPFDPQPERTPRNQPAPPPPDMPPPDFENFYGEELEEYDEMPYFSEELVEPDSASGPPDTSRKQSGSAGRQDQIRVIVGNRSLAVVGGSFQEMLTAIKAIPDRRFDGDTKQWLLPDDINSIQQHLNDKGFRLEER